jgi:eukaryotic-like serine/threonine-protein kinase
MPRSETDARALTATVHQSGCPPIWVNRADPGAGEPSPGGTPPRMAQQWYIDANGRIEGPLSAADLSERAADGRLLPSDSVSADGVKWVAAHTLPNLTFSTQHRPPLLETVVSGSIHLSDSAHPETGPKTIPVVSVRGYKLLDTLGSGACGVVYKAFHEGLKRTVALKTLLMPDRASADIIERFKQEAVALARLQHPNIVAVYDYGECEKPAGQAYIAMEVLEGEDLGARVDRTGPLDERTAWLIARQTAAALAHATKYGVVHRDVKPANLFLVPPPTGFPLPPDVPMVKVTDFGLALSRGPGTDQRQTAAGVLLGTPVYMAPEQFSGSDVDSRADIYSLGATVFHVLAGAPPFDGRSIYEVMQKKSGPVPQLAPPVSAETIELVAAMMARDASKRPADYAELIARIDALPCLAGFSSSGLPAVSGRMPAAQPPTPTPVPVAQPAPRALPRWGLSARRGRWVYVLVAVVLAGAAVGVAALAGAFNRPAQTKAPATYSDGTRQSLYERNVIGWSGQGLKVEEDDDKAPVLTGKGELRRVFSPPPHFRVTLALDPYKANPVDVVLATTDGPPATATQWLVRIDRTSGAVFGKQVGTGPFEPAGAAVPMPTPHELAEAGQRPYPLVKYERAGGTLSAWFRDQPLGSTPDTGLKTTEVRIRATGGPIRLDFAVFDELIEQK